MSIPKFYLHIKTLINDMIKKCFSLPQLRSKLHDEKKINFPKNSIIQCACQMANIKNLNKCKINLKIITLYYLRGCCKNELRPTC